MDDFFAFRRFLTPAVVHILFWIGVASCVMSGIAIWVDSGQHILVRLPVGLFTILFGVLIVRVACEIAIVVFRNYAMLVKLSGGPDTAVPQAPDERRD